MGGTQDGLTGSDSNRDDAGVVRPRKRNAGPSARIVEARADVWSADDWSEFLTQRFGTTVRVTYGRSRSAPVQARAFHPRPGETGWDLRLHGKFSEAPATVREALAKWIRVGRRARRAGPILDDWIHEAIASLPARPRRLTLETTGNAHDLRALADALFEGEFAADFAPAAGLVRPRFSWGRRARSRSRRSLRLGSFEPENRVVRVHPVLDQEAVPEWFVGFVLKHEILHAVIDTYRNGAGQWVHHGWEFRERESSWPEYQAALRWERRNLPRLIRSAREGTTLRVRVEDVALPAELENVRPERRGERRGERPPEGPSKQHLLPF